MDSAGWIQCRAFLKAQGLPQPWLPQGILWVIRPQRPGLFATPGWSGEFGLEASVAHWLATAQPSRAWINVNGHGVQNRCVSLALATPALGVFIRKRWRPGLYGDSGDDKRIYGSWQLLHQLQDGVEAIRAKALWPTGRRLLLVEDELALTYWGWVDGDPATTELRQDPRAWLQALRSVDELQ